MIKLLNIEIKYTCDGCPYFEEDYERFEYVCRLSWKYREITSEYGNKPPIPPWCELPTKHIESVNPDIRWESPTAILERR